MIKLDRSFASSNETKLTLSVGLHDVGNGGDNLNSKSTGTQNPLSLQRNVQLYVFSNPNVLVSYVKGSVLFDTSTGLFTGSFDLGSIASGIYDLYVSVPGFLIKKTSDVSITAGQTNTPNTIFLINGDINQNNTLDILDYNIIVSCFNKSVSLPFCTPADIDNDGVIGGIDYNSFLREYFQTSKRIGDIIPKSYITATPAPTSPTSIDSPTPTPLDNATPTPPTPTSAPCPSVASGNPLLFGGNLSQSLPGREYIDIPKTWDIMQGIHERMVRDGEIHSSPSTYEIKTFQNAKDHCMTMYAIMFLNQSTSGATKYIQLANSIYGNQAVYYEYGNEPNISSYIQVSAATYTSKWNSLIPKLKKIAKNGKFGGPTIYSNDSFKVDTQYIAYFVHHANPKPDFISWHFYGNNVGTFGSGVALVKAAIKANGDKVPPIFISEWNYGGNSVSSSFLSGFVKNMFNEMKKNGVAGSSIFTTTDFSTKSYLLINKSKVTTEGNALKSMYEQFVK